MPITFRNVSQPSFSASNRLFNVGNKAIQSGINGLANSANAYDNAQIADDTNAFKDLLSSTRIEDINNIDTSGRGRLGQAQAQGLVDTRRNNLRNDATAAFNYQNTANTQADASAVSGFNAAILNATNPEEVAAIKEQVLSTDFASGNSLSALTKSLNSQTTANQNTFTSTNAFNQAKTAIDEKAESDSIVSDIANMNTIGDVGRILSTIADSNLSDATKSKLTLQAKATGDSAQARNDGKRVRSDRLVNEAQRKSADASTTSIIDSGVATPESFTTKVKTNIDNAVSALNKQLGTNVVLNEDGTLTGTDSQNASMFDSAINYATSNSQANVPTKAEAVKQFTSSAEYRAFDPTERSAALTRFKEAYTARNQLSEVNAAEQAQVVKDLTALQTNTENELNTAYDKQYAIVNDPVSTNTVEGVITTMDGVRDLVDKLSNNNKTTERPGDVYAADELVNKISDIVGNTFEVNGVKITPDMVTSGMVLSVLNNIHERNAFWRDDGADIEVFKTNLAKYATDNEKYSSDQKKKLKDLTDERTLFATNKSRRFTEASNESKAKLLQKQANNNANAANIRAVFKR